MDRRRYLAGLGTAGLASAAGCLDLVFGDDLVDEKSTVISPMEAVERDG